MRIASLVLGVLALLGLFLGFIPLLGGLIWFLVLPPALLGLLLGILAKDQGAWVFNGIVILLGIFRLSLGGGLF